MAKKHMGGSLIAQNKKARHLYELLEFFEAGIVLAGSEVKSLRAGKASFNDSYVSFKDGEAFLVGLHISPYENAGYVKQDADRERKLLLHQKEIAVLKSRVEQKGLTIVPTKLYFNNSRVKVEIAVGRGKKLYDHRDALRQRDLDRESNRELVRN